MFSLGAPAKINWFLHVREKRNDGYHALQSLMQKITLYDSLSFSPSETLQLISDTKIPVEQNLVYRAALLLRKTAGVNKGAEIRLVKNIPLEAGLGGGSSDAASTLVGLNRLWSLGMSVRELAALAEQIGSDVPFFLNGPLGFVEGRGEKITPCKPSQSVPLLLVKPPVSVSTRTAYQGLDAVRESAEPTELTNRTMKADNIKFLIRSVEHVDISGNSRFRNDLEPVVTVEHPVIGEIKNRMYSEGATLSLMSGSGSAVFAVFSSRRTAEAAERAFQGLWTAVVETVTV